MLCLILIPATCLAYNPNAIKDGMEIIKGPSGLHDFNLITFISKLINVAAGLMGIIVVVLILIIGFRCMASMGSEEASVNLRKSFVDLIIGIIIIFSSYSIAHFIFSTVLSAS